MKKLLGIVVLSLLLSTSVYANCIQGDCNNGQGTWLFKNGDKYIGEHKNARGNGQGTYIFSNGTKYVGGHKDDQRHGQGTLTFANGTNHTGEFKDGKANGNGIITMSNGDKYVGEFKDDEYHGEGTYTYANGTIESGIFENGKLIEKQQVAKVKKTKQKLEKKIIKSTETKISQINNENELSNYLVEKGLVLKQTEDWIIDNWYNKVKEPVVFTFKSDGTGNLFHIEDKSEMIFIWKSLSKNSFNYKHPQSSHDPAIITIDFKNNIASSTFYYGQNRKKYQIVFDFDFTQFNQVKKEKLDEDKLKEEFWKFLDDEFIKKKDGRNLVKKIIPLINHCMYAVSTQLSLIKPVPVQIGGLKSDVKKWIYRAEKSLNENNVGDMRVSIGQLRELAWRLSSASRSYYDNNQVAQNCKSIDDDFKISYSINFKNWKKNYLSN